MNKYLKGLIKNLSNPAVSIFTQIDDVSVVNPKAVTYQFSKIFRSTIDEYSYVGRKTGLIHANVGKFCSIAGGGIIGMGTHTLDKLSTSPVFTEEHNATKRTWYKNKGEQLDPFPLVTIGNDVWIGTRVMVIGGVTIGDGAVIGAGSIVTKDVPPYAVVAGVPAKIIRYRFTEDVIEELLKIKWWDWDEKKLKENLDLFQSNDIDINNLNKLFSLNKDEDK